MKFSVTVKGKFVNSAFVKFLRRINQVWDRKCHKKICIYDMTVDADKKTIETIYAKWGNITYHDGD